MSLHEAALCISFPCHILPVSWPLFDYCQAVFLFAHCSAAVGAPQCKPAPVLPCPIAAYVIMRLSPQLWACPSQATFCCNVLMLIFCSDLQLWARPSPARLPQELRQRRRKRLRSLPPQVIGPQNRGDKIIEQSLCMEYTVLLGCILRLDKGSRQTLFSVVV